MSKHKYALGSLLLGKREDFLGYIEEHTESFYGDPQYSVYWFDDNYISQNLPEKLVGRSIKWYKDKYGE